MSPEDKFWGKMATRMQCSVEEAQERIPSTELEFWPQYINEEANDFNPIYWYLANICELLANLPGAVWGKGSKEFNPAKWILKFTTTEPEKIVKDPEDEKAQQLEFAKSVKESLVGAFKAMKNRSASARQIPPSLKAKFEAKKAAEAADSLKKGTPDVIPPKRTKGKAITAGRPAAARVVPSPRPEGT